MVAEKEKKKRSYDDSNIRLYRCVLFKKFYQHDLWLGHFGEFDNIYYCRIYIQRYINYWVQHFLLERFDLSFVIFLYKSPCFKKFIESGFLNYLDSHFLESFFNCSFTPDLIGKEEIRNFVDFYFHNFLITGLEKDVLILVTQAIDERILSLFMKHLINCLEYKSIIAEWAWLNADTSTLGNFYFTSTENKYIYSSGRFHNFRDVIENGYSFLFTKNLLVKFYPNLYRFIPVNRVKSIYSNRDSTQIFGLKFAKVSKVLMEKKIIELSEGILHDSDTSVLQLLDSVEILAQEKNISFYTNPSIFSEDFLIQKDLLFKKKKSFKTRLKSFNLCLVKYKFKREFRSEELELS